MDGLALTEAVRRSPRFADLPVVLVTSPAPARPTGPAASRSGPTPTSSRTPFDQKDLLETIAQLL